MSTHESAASSITDRTELLSRTDARAALGGISRPTLDRLRQRGDLAVVRVGGRIFFERTEIERYIAANRERAGDAP